ncbi:MAG: 6-bladed beta-propeller [Candidatus Aminicenantes bacterium]|nr:6-bladed beta-propeller [Candidatus Aminicenantes bacterium]
MRRKEIAAISLAVNWALALAIFLAIGPSLFPSANQSGIQVVENKLKPQGSKQLILKKELTVGQTAEGGSLFAGIAGVDMAGDGRLFILDERNKKLRIFDAAGKLLKELGREGKGPGEWATPFMVKLVSENEIMVADAGNRKVVYLDLQGNLTREVSYARNMGLIKLQERNGQYWAAEMGLEGNSLAYTIASYDSGFNRLLKFDTLLTPIPISGRKINPYEMYFEFCLDSRGNLLYGLSSAYEIKCFNPEGKLFRIIRKEYRPQPITEKDRQEILSQLPETAGVNVKEMLAFPDYFPPFGAFLIDEADRLYVRTFEKGQVPHWYTWDVFDPDGKLIARVEMPENTLLIKAGKLCAVEKDEEDYPYLCLYQVTWKK